jgi:hypothetical protein
LEAYKQRVILEKQELDDKLAKLKVFLDSDVYKTVDSEEQSRLLRQYGYMAAYSGVLGERIEAFMP